MTATRIPSQEQEVSKPPEDVNQLIAESSTRHMDAGITMLLPSQIDDRFDQIDHLASSLAALYPVCSQLTSISLVHPFPSNRVVLPLMHCIVTPCLQLHSSGYLVHFWIVL